MKMLQLVGVLSLLTVASTHAYDRFALQPGEKKEGATYYTDDGKYAVILTREERRTIEFILKPHTWSDQDYNATINDQYIRQRSGGCCTQCGKSACADVSECTSCSDDAQLLIEVLTDFKGKTVRIFFDKLNLRNEL